MKITIGRDSATQKLAYNTDTTPKISCQGGNVNNAVSRCHCIITIDGKGKMHIANMSPRNVTWVNGLAIEAATVDYGDRVELGNGHYPLDWETIKQIRAKAEKSKPKVSDIRHLEKVWNDYHEATAKLQRSQTMINVYRGGIPLLTIGGVALSMLASKNNPDSNFASLMPAIYAVAAVLMAAFFAKSFIDAKRMPKKRDELNKKFIHDYTCPTPGCNYFFGYQPYDVLKSNIDICPKCKAKLKK